MRENLDACLSELLRHESGYVNDPHDLGGETNMGISKRSYPHEEIKDMTHDRVPWIYQCDFWAAVRGDNLPAGLDLLAFDPVVNRGVSRGAKWLQAALGVATLRQRLDAARREHPRRGDPHGYRLPSIS